MVPTGRNCRSRRQYCYKQEPRDSWFSRDRVAITLKSLNKHWLLEAYDSMDSINVSAQGMSFFSASDIYEPTSTLQYLNAQLVAHGYARTPGISLEGLSVADNEKVVKCILGMLSQRMVCTTFLCYANSYYLQEDMKRAEELSSKHRILTYEYERLQSMHRTALNDAANAERDMTMFKTKLRYVRVLVYTHAML